MLRRHARLQIDCSGLPTLNASMLFTCFRVKPGCRQNPLATLKVFVVFCTLWSHARVRTHPIGLPSLSASLQYCMLWRHARVQIDSIGLPTLSVPIVLYTLWLHARVLIYSTGLATLGASIVFCMSGQHCCSKPGHRLIHWMAHMSLSVPIVFDARWGHARVQIDSIILPTLKVSFALFMLRRPAMVQIDSIGVPTSSVTICFA